MVDVAEVDKIESSEELEGLFVTMTDNLQRMSEEVTDTDGDHSEAEALIQDLRAGLDRIELYLQGIPK